MKIRRMQEFRETWKRWTAPSFALPFLAGVLLMALGLAGGLALVLALR